MPTSFDGSIRASRLATSRRPWRATTGRSLASAADRPKPPRSTTSSETSSSTVSLFSRGFAHTTSKEQFKPFYNLFLNSNCRGNKPQSKAINWCNVARLPASEQDGRKWTEFLSNFHRKELVPTFSVPFRCCCCTDADAHTHKTHCTGIGSGESASCTF